MQKLGETYFAGTCYPGKMYVSLRGVFTGWHILIVISGKSIFQEHGDEVLLDIG